ncbi:MAG: biopolymer transporter ExbD [Verrucomicrobia bacterium]|nr:biopolymer transporter ExbD [Verrucomicrobiota bacterium]
MFSRPKRPTLSIDMAPLMDVVFLLLIFFMLTSSFMPPSVPLTLPQAASKDSSDSAKVVVSLDGEGRVSISETVIADGDFENLLKIELQKNATSVVHFRGDKSVDYGIFLQLMSRARTAGAQQFQLVHEPLGASRP